MAIASLSKLVSCIKAWPSLMHNMSPSFFSKESYGKFDLIELCSNQVTKVDKIDELAWLSKGSKFQFHCTSNGTFR